MLMAAYLSSRPNPSASPMVTLLDNTNCLTCKSPKGRSSASLTQWISACACNNQPVNRSADPASVHELPIRLCRVCGKHINAGRNGSFTQFILRSDLCSCEVPVFMLKLAQAAGQEPADQSIYFGIDEARDESASQISEELFPIARYSPIEQIGSGSSATVFLSRDKLLNRRVAVK